MWGVENDSVKLDLIQFRDRNWFALCLGVENDLVLVSGSKLTRFFCHDVRPQVDMSLHRYVFQM